MPSIGFILSMAAVLLASGFGVGMKVTSDHYLAKEVSAQVAVIHSIKVVEINNRREVASYQRRINELQQANNNLQREIDYALENQPPHSFDGRFVGVFNAKLAGERFVVPGAAGGAAVVSTQTEAATDEALLTNVAENGTRWATCRAQVEGVRSWCASTFGERCPLGP